MAEMHLFSPSLILDLILRKSCVVVHMTEIENCCEMNRCLYVTGEFRHVHCSFFLKLFCSLTVHHVSVCDCICNGNTITFQALF